ncbi:CoA transferase [Kordiimonas lacus]|uniref:CoA transferase n=1 Tax=Kordiimonas lacus TaxID=637679 RepID=UPI000834801A|nr:CoA transferase [Kordiimonas lacus]
MWNAIAGDYRTSDGWIKLHTNLPHHRTAACGVLGVAETRVDVDRAARAWRKDELEAAIVAAGGVGAAMRTADEWNAHPQGQVIADESLIHWGQARAPQAKSRAGTAARPLAGLKVLDLTRVLAGPVATRTLAGFGAEVLRIDPPRWQEDNVEPEVTLGKRCARLNLKDADDRASFEQLLRGADILVHGYRPGALEGLGLGADWRRAVAPHLIEVSLCAYGWTGPWAGRRGFDSLVQMSSGISDACMTWAGSEKPLHLPVQALDHATGYLMAAAAIRSLANVARGEAVRDARLSLARTAKLLVDSPAVEADMPIAGVEADDYAANVEATVWGSAYRLGSPLKVGDATLGWNTPVCCFGSSPAAWME